MRYLLDKVTTRYIVQAMTKLADKRLPAPNERIAVDFFSESLHQHMLFIVPSSENVLLRIRQNSRHAILIDQFLEQVHIAYPTKYHKRWARRLRAYEFTREDASVLSLGTFSEDSEVLALGTFGNVENSATLGMHCIVTFDNGMINNWSEHQMAIFEQLETMKEDLPKPYCYALLPRVVHPDNL